MIVSKIKKNYDKSGNNFSFKSIRLLKYLQKFRFSLVYIATHPIPIIIIKENVPVFGVLPIWIPFLKWSLSLRSWRIGCCVMLKGSLRKYNSIYINVYAGCLLFKFRFSWKVFIIYRLLPLLYGKRRWMCLCIFCSLRFQDREWMNVLFNVIYILADSILSYIEG